MTARTPGSILVHVQHVPGAPLFGFYRGTVVDIGDPESAYRVRVNIPAVAMPTAWAMPLEGSGAKKTGAGKVPPVGADVIVLFEAGDPDRPGYLGGGWGRGEAPGSIGGYQGTEDPPPDVAKGDEDKLRTIESDRWIVELDDRAGRERMFFRDKATGDQVLFDGPSKGIDIAVTTALRIRSKGVVDIDALTMRLCGRKIVKNGRPIG